MRFRPCCLSFLLATCLLVPWPLVAFAANETWLLATTPVGEPAPITLTLTDNVPQITLTLYLRRTRPAETATAATTGAAASESGQVARPSAENVRVLVQLSDDRSGEPVPELTTNITVGTTDVTATGVPVPADGSPVQFALTLGKLTRIGTFTGAITVQAGTTIQELAVLTFHRFPEPALTIVGRDAGGKLQLKATTTSLQQRFPIASTNRGAISDLRVFVSSLIGPDQTMVTLICTLRGKACGSAVEQVPALDEVAVELAADLPATGTYNGQITLQYANKRETTEIVIARQRPAVSVEILNTATSRNNSRDEVRLWVTLRETAGLNVTLDPPQLASLVLTDNSTNFQAIFDHVRFHTRCEDGKAAGTGMSITLRPNEIQTLPLVVCGLAEAGSYAGSLRLSARDKEPVSQSIGFLVKESICLAGVLILLGVLASHLIRLYTLVWRPRLDHRVQVRQYLTYLSALTAEVQQKYGALVAEEKFVVDGYSTWLGDLDGALARGGVDKPADVLAEIGEKLRLLPTWFELWRRIEGLPAALRDQYRQHADWQAASTFLQSKHESLDAAQARTEAASHQQKLDALRRAIAAALKVHFQGLVNTLRQQITDWRTNTSDPHAERDLLPRLATAAQLVTGEKYTDLESTLADIRARFAHYQARALQQRLNAVTAPNFPAGFEAESWRQLREEVTTLLATTLEPPPVEAAVKVYESAYDRFLEGLIDALRTAVAPQQETLQRQQDDLTADRQEQTQKLETASPQEESGIEAEIERLDREIEQKTAALEGLWEVVQQLVTAQRQRLEGQLSQAEAAYSQAAGDYVKLTRQYQLLGAQQTVMVTGVDTLPAISGDTMAGPTTLAHLDQQLPSLPFLSLLRMLGDWTRFFLVTLVAMFLGLNLLWVNDATWGGWADYLTALLWGLGLHQISGAAFPGIGGLQQQLTQRH